MAHKFFKIKNIDNHMDSGSYSSLKFDPQILLIKNILSLLFIIGFIIENRRNKSPSKNEKELVKTQKCSILIVELKEKKSDNNSILKSLDKIHQLTDTREKFYFG